MMSFEEAVQTVMHRYKVDRPGALTKIGQWRDAGDPELANIKDFESEWASERNRSILHQAIGDVLDYTTEPVKFAKEASEWGLRKLGASESDIAQMTAPLSVPPEHLLNRMLGQQYERQVGTVVNIPGVGPMHIGPELIGQTIGQMPLWAMGEGLLEEVPVLGAKVIGGGLARRAIIGGAQTYGETGDFQKAKAGAVAAAVLPAIFNRAVKIGWRGIGPIPGVGTVLDRILKSPDVPVDPDMPVPRTDVESHADPNYTAQNLFTEIPPEPEPPPAPTTPEAAAAAVRVPGEPEPPKPSPTLAAAAKVFGTEATPDGISKTAADLLRDRKEFEDANQPLFFNNARDREPFTSNRSVQLVDGPRGNVYGMPEHPDATERGVQREVTVQRPRIIQVKGNNYMREALEQVYPNAPGLLGDYDEAAQPDSLVREILGREAKNRGYDSVIIKGNDPAKDILIDYRDFEKAAHPDLSKEATQAISKERISRRVLFRAEPAPPDTEHADMMFRRVREPLEPRKVQDVLSMTPGERESAAYKRWLGEAPLDEVATHYGYLSAKDMTAAIEDATKSPFDYVVGEKRTADPLIIFNPDAETKAAVKAMPLEMREATTDAIKGVFARYPRLARLAQNSVGIRSFKKVPGLMRTGARIYGYTGFAKDEAGNLTKAFIWLNADLLPGTPEGDRSIIQHGYGLEVKEGEKLRHREYAREHIAETLVHELDHVAQFKMASLGPHVRALLSVPELMDRTMQEQQAHAKGELLRWEFQKHAMLRDAVNTIDPDVRQRVLESNLETYSERAKRELRNRINLAKTSAEVLPKLAGQMEISPKGQRIGGRAPRLFREEIKNLNEIFEDYDVESRTLPIGAEVDPQSVYSDETKGFFAQTEKYGRHILFGLVHPSDVSDHPGLKELVSKSLKYHDEGRAFSNELYKKAFSILKGVPKEDVDLLFQGAQGLKIRPDGSYFQTDPDIPERLNEKLTAWRRDVMDVLWHHMSGYTAQTAAIIHDFGLRDTEQQLARLKLIQRGGATAVKDAQPAEVKAATATDGMLNWGAGHDLRPEYKNGYITMQPVQNMRAQILDNLAHIKRVEEIHGSLSQAAADVQAAEIKRLEEIDKKLAARRMKSPPMRDTVPKQQFWGPMALAKEPDLGMYVEKDLPLITAQYIDGAVHKHIMDQVLSDFHRLGPGMPGSVRDFGVNYINGIRGIKGFREDTALVDMANKIQGLNERWFGGQAGGRRRFTPESARVGFSNFMQFNVVTKLSIGPARFPLVQLSHNATTLIVAGPRAFGRGLAYILKDYPKALREAMDAHVIFEDSDYLREAKEFARGSTHSKWLVGTADFLSKHIEHQRKTLAYHVFRMQADEPGFKPFGGFRTFLEDVPGRSLIERSRDYGRAGVEGTQFRMTAEGKPTGLVGGFARRSMGQFRSWGLNYTNLFFKVLKHGDPWMWGRAMASIYFLGGYGAPFGESVYNWMRREFIKHGFILPKETGFQTVANWVGLGGTLGSFDITTFREPFELSRSLEGNITTAAGPTVGTAFSMLEALGGAQNTGQAIKGAISAISPQARAGLDAYLEYKHGGIRAPTGELQVGQRPGMAVLMRGLDLSPSIKTQRYDYENDIIAAFENNQYATAYKLIAQARAKGIIFGKKARQRIKAKVKEYKRENREPLERQLQ